MSVESGLDREGLVKDDSSMGKEGGSDNSPRSDKGSDCPVVDNGEIPADPGHRQRAYVYHPWNPHEQYYLGPYPPQPLMYFYPHGMTPTNIPIIPADTHIADCPEGSYTRNGTTFFPQPNDLHASQQHAQASSPGPTMVTIPYQEFSPISTDTTSASNCLSTGTFYSSPSSISDVTLIKDVGSPCSTTHSSVSGSVDSPTRRRRRRRRRRRGTKKKQSGIIDEQGQGQGQGQERAITSS